MTGVDMLAWTDELLRDEYKVEDPLVRLTLLEAAKNVNIKKPALASS